MSPFASNFGNKCPAILMWGVLGSPRAPIRIWNTIFMTKPVLYYSHPNKTFSKHWKIKEIPYREQLQMKIKEISNYMLKDPNYLCNFPWTIWHQNQSKLLRLWAIILNNRTSILHLMIAICVRCYNSVPSAEKDTQNLQ